MTTQADLPERKPRKSVAFSEGATIVDSNGDVTESKEMNGDKDSAETHSAGAGETVYIMATEKALTGGTTGDDKEVEEVTDMFADLAKKVRYTHGYRLSAGY
jgi:translation initiation factor 2 subunit 2